MEKTYTVNDVNEIIKGIVDNIFNESIKVTGEISNMKLSKGHLYMTLKDKESAINITCWSFQKKYKDLKINNGDNVMIVGRLTVYSKLGSYNINVLNIEKTGTGDIHSDQVKLKEEYEKKGYFNNKRELPPYPQNVAVVTAANGAALQDILSVLNKNKYTGNIFIKNCVVQGKDCPKSVADALKYMDQFKHNDRNMDVIILARGGGSVEDLMGFSDPRVLEALHSCKTVTISAIGHEVDTMLSDLVADVRAATPSVSAELISSNNLSNKLFDAMMHRDNLKSKVTGLIDTLEHNIIANLKKIANGLKERVNDKLNAFGDDIIKNSLMVTTLDGSVVTVTKDIEKKKKLKLHLQDSIVTISYKIEQIKPNN